MNTFVSKIYHKIKCYISVTNITLTLSAMVNWNRRLLIKGVTTVVVIQGTGRIQFKVLTTLSLQFKGF